MPIYEYRCRACRKKSVYLVLNIASPPALICRHCGSNDLEKLVSRIAILRSEDDRVADLAESPGLGGVDEKDPRSIARWMKKMGREMGEDLGEDIDRTMEEPLEEAADLPSSDEDGDSDSG